MAFGFPASFKTSVTTIGSRDEARQAIVAAFQTLGWKYEILGPDSCTSKISVTPMSWGETLTVELTGENTMQVKSSCTSIQIFDWGKNRQNVDKFVSTFSQHMSSAASSGGNEAAYADAQSPIQDLFREGESGGE